MSPQVITCKAAVAWGPGEKLVMEDVEVNPPQPMEIRIKVVCTSLCRSDLTAWQSKATPSIFPRIFGHEASGIVESVGEGVTEFQEGDHVLTLFTGECTTCRHCTSSKSNMCQVLGLERRGVMHSDQKTRFSIQGKPVYHYCAVSSFSEYTVVHSGCAVKVRADAPLEKLCLLSCGVAAGLGAAWKVADISEQSTVVVFGLGTVGLSVALGAKLRGASQVIGVDTNSDKFLQAEAFGVTKFLNPSDYDEPIQQVIKGMTDGGADFAFECVGDTAAVTTALQSCADGWGLTVTLGVPKMDPEVKAHYGLLLFGRTLKGSLFGGWKPKSDIPKLVDMYMDKVIPLDAFITHDLQFSEINTAFELMTEGKCLRCVIHMPKMNMQNDNSKDRQNHQIRRLEITDKSKGFIELLRQLTVCGSILDVEFQDRFQELVLEGDNHVICVIEDEDTGRIIATGSVFIEKKFIRNCGKVGHIEDVVVDASARGMNLGKKVIDFLTFHAQSTGCYKVILDCSADNKAFYEKCGFSPKEIQMIKYFR